MTNADLYNLFVHYGNVVSVRYVKDAARASEILRSLDEERGCCMHFIVPYLLFVTWLVLSLPPSWFAHHDHHHSIMVEKDTQRSRGFGFVSYDCVESADLAIKFMDGYQV